MNIRWRNQFKKDYKHMIKQGRNIDNLDLIIAELAVPNQLPDKNRDHFLKGEYANYKECHIEPDWLLIYGYEALDKNEQQLLLVRTGSHSDLLK